MIANNLKLLFPRCIDIIITIGGLENLEQAFPFS